MNVKKISAVVLAAAALTLTACSGDGPSTPPDPPTVNSYIEGKVIIHKVEVNGLDRKGTYGAVAANVVTWCEGTTLYATTPMYQIDRGGAGGGIAIALNGCKDGEPK